MKLTCNTIQDILPLVAEDLASEDTKELVNKHLKDCPKCREEYEELIGSKTAFESKKELESIPLKDVKRKLKNISIYNIVLTVLIMSLLVFIGLDRVRKPIALSFDEAVESTVLEDTTITIEFKPGVYYDVVSSSNEKLEYEIMAWKTNNNPETPSKNKRIERKSLNIKTKEEKPVLIRFISQSNELDKIIYGAEEGYGLTLPRLAMNYYFMLMGGIFLISGALWLIFRKTQKIKNLISIIMYLSLSYLLGHIAIMGLSGPTHHMKSDLSSVLISTILIFTIIILLVYKNKLIRMKRKDS